MVKKNIKIAIFEEEQFWLVCSVKAKSDHYLDINKSLIMVFFMFNN